MKRFQFAIGLAVSVLLVAAVGCGQGDSKLIVGATTSLDDSGILQELIDEFKEQSGFSVTPVIAGSGQVLELGRRGERDVTLTHSPSDEAEFLAGGFGVDSLIVMENAFLLVGPEEDLANVASAASFAGAFAQIAATESSFISRGDESGTNQRETEIWAEAGVDPAGESWYQESAVGQGQNLLVTNDKQAYTLVDSSTFAVLRERVDLVGLMADDAPNRYRAIRVDPSVHERVNEEVGRAFMDFLASEAAAAIIQSFGREEYGQQLFFLPGTLDEPPAFPFPLQ